MHTKSHIDRETEIENKKKRHYRLTKDLKIIIFLAYLEDLFLEKTQSNKIW